MSREVENRITKMDLDGSGFIRGAKKVEDAIAKLEDALQFKGAEAGVSRLSAAINGTLTSAFAGASAAASRFSSAISAEFASASQQAATGSAIVAESFAGIAAQAENAFSGIGARLAQEFAEAENAASAFSGGIVSSFQNAADSAENAVGAASVGIGAKIAGIAKTAAVVGVTAAAIGVTIAAVCAAAHAKIGATVDGVRQKISDGVGNIRETVVSGLETVKSKLQEAAGKAKVPINKFINELRITLQTAFPQTYAIVAGWAASVHAKFEELKNRVAPVFSAIFTGISVTFEKIRSVTIGVIEAIREQFSSVATGISSVFSKVSETVRGFAEKISSHFKKNKDEAAELAQQAEELSVNLNNAASAASNLGGSLNGVFGNTGADAEVTAEAVKDIADAFKETSDTGATAAAAIDSVGEETRKMSEDIQKAMTWLDESEDDVEDFTESADDAGDEVEELGEKAEESGKKAGGAFEGLRKLLYSIGHDLGELPFKLDEIGEKGGTVGKVLSSALGFGIDKLKDLGGKFIPLTLAALGDKLRGAKKDMEGVTGEADASDKAMKALGDAASGAVGKFSHLGAVAFGALERIGQKAADAGIKLMKSLSVDNIAQGWGEYGLKINSTQTIMASTGESLQTVNGYLEELNKYADRTIYSFSDMTANIGKFTNAGVDLDTAVAAIKGISNEAALSGANAQEASRTMYNIAQALSSGAVKLIDWKSIENANMATKGFKEQLIETAVELGTLTKSGEEYISTTTDANGHVAEAFTATKKFNDSLSSQWMTTQVLTTTLAKYADETTDFGKKAYAAAQDIKTGAQLMDTLKEAVGSGWSRTFELIVGDLEDAKSFWTGVSNLISPVIEAVSGARNGLLEGWRALGGRETLLASLKDTFTNLIDILKAAKEGFETFLPPVTAERLKKITDGVAGFISNLKLNDEQLLKVKAVFGKIAEGIKSAADSFKQLFGKLGEFLGDSGAFGRLREAFSELFGAKDIFSKDGLLGVIDSLVDRVTSFVQSNVIGTIRDHLGSIATVAQNVISLITAVFEHLGQIFSSAGELMSSLGGVIRANLDDILSFIDGAVTAAKGVLDVLAAFVKTKLDTFKTLLPPLLDIALDLVNKLGDALRWLGEFASRHATGIANFIKVFLGVKAVLPVMGTLLSAIAKIKSILGIFSMIKGLKVPISIISGINKALGTTISNGAALSGVLKGIGSMVLSTVGPWIAAAAAIAAVGVAIGAILYYDKKHTEALQEEIRQTYGMTEEQKAFNQELEDGAEAYRDMAEARKKSYENVNGEYDYYQSLSEELEGLVDENGKVKDGYEARVSFITGELSKALGIEIEIVDGVIQKYGELNGQITDLIENKRKYALLDAAEEGYREATRTIKTNRQQWGKAHAEKDEADDQLAYAKSLRDTAIKDYLEHNDVIHVSWLDSYSEIVQEFIKANNLLDNRGFVKVDDMLTKVKALYNEAETASNEAAKAVENADEKYYGAMKDIANYENLKGALDSGDKGGSEIYALKLQYDFVPAEGATQEALAAQEAAFQKYYEDLKALADKGAEGITQDMVDEAELMWALATQEVKKGAEELAGVQKDALLGLSGKNTEGVIERQMKQTGKARAKGLRSTAEENREAAEIVSKSTDEALGSADTKKTGETNGKELSEGTLSTKNENAKAGKEVAEGTNKGFSLVNFYTTAYNKALEWARGVVAGLKNQRSMATISAAAQTLANLISKVTGKTMQTGSPSKVAMRLGGYWGEGLALGLEGMEKAVSAESATLSETLIDGAAPLSYLNDILSGDFDDTLTVTPVLDLSQIRNGAQQMGALLDAADPLRLGRFGIDISQLTGTANTEDDRALKELRGLRRDMAEFNERIRHMEVRLDTGEVVGALRDPMDEALGGLIMQRGRR